MLGTEVMKTKVKNNIVSALNKGRKKIEIVRISNASSAGLQVVCKVLRHQESLQRERVA